MAHTIKQVAEIANISTQTLRFYDKIGLLQPAYYGENGYRYYKREQLLTLQEILFFRELGFELKAIKGLISTDSYSRMRSLRMQRNKLLENIKHSQKLINTVDKTIKQIKGEIIMNDEELFEPMTAERIKKAKDVARKYMKDQADDFIDTVSEHHNSQKPTKKQALQQQEQLEKMLQSFVELIESDADPEGEEAQALMAEYYKQKISPYYEFDRDEFINFCKMQTEHPESKKNFDSVHFEFASYFMKAAIFYGANNLKKK